MKVRKKIVKSSKAKQADEEEAAPRKAPAVEAEALELSTAAQGWKGFCKAFATIMGKSLELQNNSPVMCQTEVAAKIIERRKAYKEQKVKNLKEKASRDRGYTIPDVTKKAFELGLRRVATQGIVRLFNAVKDYQSRQDEQDTSQLVKGVVMRKKAQIMADVSKEKFEKLLNSVDKKDRAQEQQRRKEAAGSRLSSRDKARQPARRPMAAAESGMDEFA